MPEPSNARNLWKRMPEPRKVDPEDAHVILHDDVRTAEEGIRQQPFAIHIVVCRFRPKDLPKGAFWIVPDADAGLLALIRTLQL